MSSNNPECKFEEPSHVTAKQHAPYPEKPHIQNDMEQLVRNSESGKKTMPTGYIDHCEPKDENEQEEAPGSDSYTHGWDKGFAQEGDPYGIQSEYVAQSPNPNAAVPSQAQADQVVEQARQEELARRSTVEPVVEE